MILKSDIFIQNLLPGTLEKYGLDSKSLRKKNKKLITCDISGYDSKELTQRLKLMT